MKKPIYVMGLIRKLRLDQITEWASTSAGSNPDVRKEGVALEKANVVTSSRLDRPGKHALVIDLDIPAWLVESSTPGHSHLYVDATIDEALYFKLLDALADAGVIEHGYATTSKAKGYTSVRLPWTHKWDSE